MKTFIKVLGLSPAYKSLHTHLWLDVSLVAQVYPIYAIIKEDGVMWKASPADDGAEVVSYGLLDFAGNRYSCMDLNELAKLGFNPNEEIKATMGFVQSEHEDEPDPIDLGPY